MGSSAFTYTRRVAFGECDPARIYYAPRAVDYAVEAVESWLAAVAGIRWPDPAAPRSMEATFARIDCDYLHPLVAGQVVQVQVEVLAVGRASLTLAAVGMSVRGEPCFRVRLVVCLVQGRPAVPIPLPEELRRRIEAYRAQCGEPGAAPAGSASSFSLPPLVPAGGRLFFRPRRVVSGDCGAAGNLYAPKVFDYAVEAVGEWYEAVPRVSWLELVSTRGQGAPFVSARCEYLRPLGPGQVLTLAVWVTRLGGASLAFAVGGYAHNGELCFDVRLAACFIDQKGFRSMPVPEEYRRRIEAYRAGCGAVAP